MPTFNPDAKQPTVQILNGDYPFQITKVEEKISQGPKTRGHAVRELTLDFYSDKTFTQKVASIRDSLIDHPSCDWKFSLLAKCVGFLVTAGEAFDVTEEWIGYRGFAHVSPEPDQNDPKKEWNHVRVYLTDREQLAPAPEPTEPPESDDVPF